MLDRSGHAPRHASDLTSAPVKWCGGVVWWWYGVVVWWSGGVVVWWCDEMY